MPGNNIESLPEKNVKYILSLLLLISYQFTGAQSVETSFNNALKRFLGNSQLKHATIGLVVKDMQSGKMIAVSNPETGFAPASTQKIITAAAAYQLLGKDFRYETKIFYSGSIENGTLKGNIFIRGSGDPTLGSWRYSSTKEQNVINEITAAIRQAGIRQIDGHVFTDESDFADETIPDGWIWQDVGNYYGAGAEGLNWRENQYDLYLKSGSVIGSRVTITGTLPPFIAGLDLTSELKAARAGSGDNAYIYLPLFGNSGAVRGTIPVNENKFTISGTLPNPAKQLAITLESALKKFTPEDTWKGYPAGDHNTTGPLKQIYTIQSPTLDSISYWFLKKSINLYGEALLKTLGQKFGETGSTEEGLKVVKKLWAGQGIDKAAIKMMDGSGLSPQNRITPEAMVNILSYAIKQPWFANYYDGFPVYNGIRMKSGSINGVISYTGTVKGKSGNYIFAFIVNNYDGPSSQTRQKMWRLLDVLK